MMVPELDDGTPSCLVSPITPSRRKESPRRVRFRREVNDGKLKLTLSCWAKTKGVVLKNKKMMKKMKGVVAEKRIMVEERAKE